jgi:hypothetical protein
MKIKMAEIVDTDNILENTLIKNVKACDINIKIWEKAKAEAKAELEAYRNKNKPAPIPLPEKVETVSEPVKQEVKV